MAVRHCLSTAVSGLIAAAAVALLGAMPARAADERADGTTTLPIPRFVSLKSNSAMMRTGPDDRRFPIAWEYKRRGLPLEIIREYGIWRQVRDPDGTIGWMNKSLLTGERTGFVTGGIRTLYTSPDLQARVAWRIEPGTVVTITLCENVWCRVSNAGRSGYILRNQLWGTYPNEAIGR
ncbi:SH3 domain-containing protein [Sandarakinorhabdus sp. DWP1-3-1]|uniref:SH3 domain-containing protein n=1 Tax=Sandarakinorhabdus sp. DWP1-3-1 TaxID=2804627 RepID=UPI003CFA951F